MKKIKLIIVTLLLLCNFAYSITYVSNTSGPWETSTTWTPNGVPGASDDITISSGHIITYTGTLISGISSGASGIITVNVGGTLTITNGFIQSAGSRSRFTNNGTLNIIANGLTQNQGSDSSTIDRTILTNNGTMNITGDFINDQNTSLTTGTSSNMNFYNSNFRTKASAIFTNNGIVSINNTGFSGKNVTFDNINYSTDLLLNSGSIFNVTKSDVIFTGYNSLTINGHFNVTDGNISETMSITVGVNGLITTKDSDASGDGIIIFNNGGQTVTNNGGMYIESMSTTGGGMTIVDNNMVFIHNLSTGTFDNNANILNVSATGKLYYCSNPVRSTVLGTVSPGGKLYYSKETGSYPTTSPRDNPGEIDYTVAIDDQVDMATIGFTNCSNAFYTKLSIALPIELIEFKGTNKKELVYIEWTTASEENNDYFTLFRSYDGLSFDKITEIKGAGNSSYFIKYDYIDYDAQSGINYYKLKQTDYDGKNTDSKIISINRNDLEFNIMIYPISSTTPNVKMIVHKKIGIVNVKCLNTNGQSILSETIDTDIQSEYEFGKFNLTSGTYFIKLETPTNIYIKEIIIKK
ncbi:hypothetical protein M0Q50_02020 [bacterium]|jgi:hypothetical protein|nr:hypothetical protein [bacterium]